MHIPIDNLIDNVGLMNSLLLTLYFEFDTNIMDLSPFLFLFSVKLVNSSMLEFLLTPYLTSSNSLPRHFYNSETYIGRARLDRPEVNSVRRLRAVFYCLL